MSDAPGCSPGDARTARAQPTYPEREIWLLTKNDLTVRLVLRVLDDGFELRVMNVNSSFVLSRTFRHGESGLDAQAAEWRQAFLDRGWTDAAPG